MRFTIRQRLLALLGIAAAGFGFILITGVLITRDVSQQLDALEAQYVPLVNLRPRLEAEFEQLANAFQDAVVANDEGALATAAAVKDRLVKQINESQQEIGRATAIELRDTIEAYYASAYGIAQRLMQGDAGFGAVDAMLKLQNQHARVINVLEQTTEFNRDTLRQAFELTHAALSKADRQRLIMGAAGVLAALLLALWILRDLLASITMLNTGLARFGRGEFSTPIASRRHDELGAVAASANQMAGQIQELLVESRRKSESLEAANRELEAFSYSVSHDLRAPLRAIDGFSRALVLDFGETLDPQARHYLDRVRAATQRMSALIDDILNLSRISRAPLEKTQVDLTAITRSIVGELQARDPARHVALEVEPGLAVQADARLLLMAMENLLGNAWKFTSKQPAARIWVGRRSHNGESVYYVRDNGAGFDMAQGDRLFGAFQRLHDERDYEGTGVGLANVQRVIRRHGGRIWAEGAPGAGATFYFTLGSSE